MFPREAAWIGQRLAKIPAEDLSPLVDIGASAEKPWVDALIFAPLRARGVKIVHLNIVQRPWVDLVADILTEEGFATVAALEPRMVLCCNVLEHVEDAQTFARRCFDLLAADGRLLVTVPRAYPHHRAPIDTMFRPTPDEVAALIPDAEMTHSAMLPMGYYWDEIRRRPWILSRQILRAPFPFLGWKRYRRTMSKLRFLVSPYMVTFALFEKSFPCKGRITRPG
jgi:SAM-dependent methyltransferase